MPGKGRPFPKGHKYGGAKPGAGAPTKEESQIKAELIRDFWAEVYARKLQTLDKYFREDGHARDLINRLVPYAKQQIDLSGEVGVRPWVVDAYTPKKKEKK